MLETSRLKLVPLTHAQLLLYKSNPEELANSLKVKYIERQHDPLTINDLEDAIEFWITNTLLHADHFEWFTNWEILLKHERLAIGGIGFAGVPDEEGKSIVGYGLDIRFHGHGYATEALAALLKWGFVRESLKTVIADTPLKNIPSQKVLIKNQFNEIGRDETLIHWSLNR